MANDIIELHTGQFSSVLITINSSSLVAIKKALTNKVKKSPLFFQNVPVIVQFNPFLQKMDLLKLQQLLAEFGINLIGVSNWQNNLEKELVLSYNLPALGKSTSLDEIMTQFRYVPPKIVRENVTAGQVIYAKNCDLIIHGDVAQGAEVAADGNIHIYGKLQGRAMAGVNADSAGSSECAVYTQYLDAEFLSVCKRFVYKSQIPIDYLLQAVRIEAQNNALAYQYI
ncbi:septum site-determining protein MinC [Pasteurella testudinis DSM 23072]|uniref:Probable septum site-determining protein MinC n=1 Tax=Pasteurella testudinis DSM 23072 TaxID=1122938 RepID=A0A1W1UHD5_9PAST|nr:septum site-determining protein MinC [Pasteurella testudinis]SMB80453.1 septum site-determining protein MinC [Pasteurella testudinis DSM 23072]SUB51898.1 septum site-determining protein MinC [Pasteurella testudinis]